MKAVLITSSILILLIAALRPLLRGKIDPRVQYALWLVAALRLLIPVDLVDSAYSALALLERAEGPAQVAQAIGQAAVPIPAMSYEDAYDQALSEYQQSRPAAASFVDLDQVEARAREIQAKAPTLSELAARYARPVWLAGTAVTAAWFLLVNLRLRRRLKGAAPVEADCPLPVYVSDALPSPCLCGAVRPAVYVTPAVLERPDRLDHVLAHELTHYRHKDHWWALVRCACLCLYWFDPLVWWAAALSRQDCELACDEGAIRRLGEEQRLSYGRTLVDMIAAGHDPLLQTATTMAGGKRRVRERIKLIARRPKTVVALALAALLLVGCAVGCTFTGAPEGGAGPGPSPSLEPDAERPTLDTLRERLDTIPNSITGVAISSDPVVDASLTDYFLDGGDPDWENWLITVCQWDQLGFEDWLYNGDTGTFHVFARDAEHYYAIMRPTSVQCSDEDRERWAAAQKAIGDHARQQVLSTQGVEPYDADELRSRDCLWEGKTYTDIAYWPYKNVNGSTDIVWILRLVQLAKDGEGGVWIPERCQIVDPDVDPTPHHVRPAEAQGMTITEYAAQLQAEADAGNADWATDPIQVCMHFALTDFGHSGANVTEDCFTWDSAYIERVLAGLLPTEEELAIQAAMDNIIASPNIELTLAPAGTSRVYAYTIPSLDEWDADQRYWAYSLGRLPTGFGWEYLGGAVGDLAGGPQGDALKIRTPDGSFLQVWSDSNIMLIQRTSGDTAETAYYEAKALGGDADNAPLGTSRLDPGPYQILREHCFDEVELSALRATSVPDRGQSHEDVVREWIQGFEGAMTKCAPGSQYACTYVQAQRVTADAHAHLTAEEMADFAQYRGDGFEAEDYGKTWFTFGYSLVFVPVDQSTASSFWAGNTWYYEEDDAPEGALTYSRVGYMQLIDGSWVCEGCGTGW